LRLRVECTLFCYLQSRERTHVVLVIGLYEFFGETRLTRHFSFLFCFVLFIFVLCLVCPMLPASLDCPFLIAPSVFSDVYFIIKLPVWDVFPQFQQYFSFILLLSFIGGEKITRRRLQTNKSLTSLWKNVISSTPRHVQESNSQL
jgi:hypothetical protein